MRFANIIATAGLLLAHLPAVAQTSPPPAPVVTVSATLKEVVFDWEPVPGAYTYWLLEKQYDARGVRTYFTPIQDRIPGSRSRAAMPVAVHQLRWWENRYIVAACNTAGCTRSAEVSVADVMLDAIGYLKASNSEAGDRFGSGIAMSADGTTLAVSAPDEDGAGTGVDGNQADNSSEDSGAVYVFRRTGRQWAQEAYLKAGDNQPGQGFGSPVDTRTKTMAISADGSWLAVGTPAHDSPELNAGVVYLFRRDANGWLPAGTLHSPASGANDQFGFSVDMSHDGRTLKVSSLRPYDNLGNPVGSTHIYVRPGDNWEYSITLAPWHEGDECPTVRMATHGRTLVAACRTPDVMRAITWRLVAGNWVRVAENPIRGFKVGQPMAIDHHATTLALWEDRYPFDAGYDMLGGYSWMAGGWVLGATSLGPRGTSWPSAIEFDSIADNTATSDMDSTIAGAGVINEFVGGGYGGVVAVLRSDPAITDRHPRVMLKAPNPDPGDAFGAAMGFSGNGRILAVGAPEEDSAARGIDGDRTSNAAEDSGAVYLY